MFSGLFGFGNGNKTSNKPVTITREEPPTSKISDTECIQHLRDTKNKLNNFNKTLLSIRSNVNTFFDGITSPEQLAESRKNLHLQITELYNDMQLEETRIGSIAQMGGSRRK